MKKRISVATLCLLATIIGAQSPVQVKPRILISTDIGGTDPDDNQSMTHLLMYNDLFTIEGIVSSPSYGHGSKEEIFRMINLYEKDFPKLKIHKRDFAEPDYLRSITKQGRLGGAPYKGYQTPTEGSEWIINVQRKKNHNHFGSWSGVVWMIWRRHCMMNQKFRRK